MKVDREEVRKALVAKVKALCDVDFPLLRVSWPGFAKVDVSQDKTPYMNVRLIYMDGDDVGIGPDVDLRNMGTIQLECCYKEGDLVGMVTVNNLIDKLLPLLSSNDSMYPVRTYPARQVTPPNGPESGWSEEGVVVPFWYDSSK